MSTQNSTNMEYNEEYTEDSEVVASHSYDLLKIEYENCKQEIHDLKRKLRLNEVMLREVQEANESLERSLDRRTSEKEQAICEAAEKHRTLVKEYENVISNLETKLTHQRKEIEELKQRVSQRTETESIAIVDQPINLCFETDNIFLRNRIDELLSIIREEKIKYERAEQTIEELKARCDDYECYSRNIKEQLDEKNQALEQVRTELRCAGTALQEIHPTYELRKGNSLFAEVEDRRQNAVSKMNVLGEKYMETKRMCKLQIAEIKMLRSERVAILKKWENNADHVSTENEELIKKYKSRISDLESKLKFEIKKNDDSKQSNCGDKSFRYFQSLLDAKSKEIDELRIKLEDICTKFLVREETVMNITKQLHYWRYKASSLQAKIHTMEAESKLDLTNDAEHEILKEFDGLVLEPDNMIIDVKQSDYEQQSQNLARSLQSNNSHIIKHTRCSTENIEDFKTHVRLTDKERTKEMPNCSDIEEFQIITPERSCKFEHNRNINHNENKSLDKLLHSMESTTIEKSTIDCKYPVVYIPNNFND